MHIESEDIDGPAERLATTARIEVAETVRMAPTNELQRREASLSLAERIRPIQDRIARYPKTGLEADKAFFDDLNGEP